MANETQLTITGNLVRDPEMRFVASGAAVTSFTVASTPRAFDKRTNEWKDGETLFMDCSIWREAAENVAESLTKGMRVIVTGRLTQRSYENREGQRQTVVELQVDEVGPSLKYATAKVARSQKSHPSDLARASADREASRLSKAAYGGTSEPDPWATEPGW